MTDSFEHRLRTAARSIATPPAPTGLIERVVAERARGEHVTPIALSHIRRKNTQVVSVLATLAGLAALIAFIVLRFGAAKTRADSFTSNDGFFVSTAYAQAAIADTPTQPVTGIDGTRIVPRRYEYRLQFVDSTGKVTPNGGGSVTVAADSAAGTLAWQIVLDAQQTEGDQLRTSAETLLVSRRELRPLTRSVHVRPYRGYSSINIAQRFVGDSILGEMTTDGGVRRPIARRLSPRLGPFISDAIAPLALVGVPLSVGWQRSLSVLGWAVVPNDVVYTASLKVVGEERVSTPTGAYECWKLSVVAGKERRTEWVRKSDGIGLRSIDEAPTPTGRREYVLLNP